jgi:hypothetical protein
MTEPTGSLRAALAGEVRGIASVIRAFPNDEAWGGADMAQKVAATLDRAVAALAQPAPPTEATEARAAIPCDGSVMHAADMVHGMGWCVHSGRGCHRATGSACRTAPTEATPPHDGLRDSITGEALFRAFMAGDVTRLTTTALPEEWPHMKPSYRKAWEDFAAALSPSEVQPASEMPTIWEDPAGKGYPCQERPMTPKEASETIDRLSAQVVEMEAIADRLIDQQGEPWPGGTESDRLHYWRDKAITASRELFALSDGKARGSQPPAQIRTGDMT